MSDTGNCPHPVAPQSAETKLLSCPFCGGGAVVEEVPSTFGVSFSVGCNSHDEASCMGYQTLQTFARKGEAIKAWNTRASSPTADGSGLGHTRSCAALGSHESDCTCCLAERKALATEKTMHRAWRKRAEEAETELTALRNPLVSGSLDGETIQTLLDLLNPLHGDLDKQTYNAKVAMDFDMPPDYAHDATVTSQQERDLTQAVQILEDRKRKTR